MHMIMVYRLMFRPFCWLTRMNAFKHTCIHSYIQTCAHTCQDTYVMYSHASITASAKIIYTAQSTHV